MPPRTKTRDFLRVIDKINGFRPVGRFLAIARQRLERRRLLLGSGELERGFYKPIGSGLWNIAVPVPGHLLETKGAERTSRRSVKGWLVDVLLAVVLLLLRPPVVVCNRGGGASGAMLSRHGDQLFFDVWQRHVLRKTTRPAYLERYVELRTSFASTVRQPRFCVVSQQEIREEMLVGEPLSSLPPLQRVQSIESVLGCLLLKVVSSPDEESRAYRRRIEHRVESSIFPLELELVLLEGIQSHLLDRARLVPSHGDIVPHNIMVLPNDELAIIDWEPRLMGRRPFWFDSMRLVVMGDDETRGLFRRGYYDRLTVDAWREFLPGLSPQRERDIFVGTTCLVAADMVWPSAVNHEEFTARLSRDWELWMASG